ncbi:MAG: hypothetical protein JSW52_06045 [Candidatus Coatesbacteria bacterium]|nr:MAG: hypothetical protein JSW52_06045 [Candidatus Coatesbacteria bacterium]
MSDKREYTLRSSRITFAVFVTAFFFIIACQQTRAPGTPGLSPDEAREVWARYGAFFPKDTALGEWKRAADFEYADSADVAGLLEANGDAYVAYSCVEVVRVTYAHESDASKDIIATVADMGEADAAYGLFTYLRPEGAELWDGGDGAERGPTYIAFATDKYYVRVETGREFFGGGAALDELAVGLAVRLPKAGKVPDLVNLLPGTDLNANLVKFGKGPAVLVSLRPDLEPYVEFYAEEGNPFVLGSYGDAHLMIVEWDPEGDSEKRFDEIIERTGAEQVGSFHGGGVKAYKRFANTRPILLCLNGNFAIEVFEYEDEKYARAILEQATGPVVEISGATLNFL